MKGFGIILASLMLLFAAWLRYVCNFSWGAAMLCLVIVGAWGGLLCGWVVLAAIVAKPKGRRR